MKCKFVLAVSLFSALAFSAFAQTAPLPDGPSPSQAASLPDGPSATALPNSPVPPANIAVIAFQQVVAQTNEGKRMYVELRAKYASQEAHLQTLDNEIIALTKELNGGTKLPALQRAKLSREIDTKKKQLDQDAATMHRAANKDIQAAFEGISSKIFKVLEVYVKQHGYTQVLDTSSKESPFVLYASPSTDITKPMIAYYNEKSGVTTPTKAATGAKSTPAKSTAPSRTHRSSH